MTQLRQLGWTAAHVAFTALIAVGLIKLETPLAEKALIVGVLSFAYFFIWMIESLLHAQIKLLVQLLYFQRVTYIAIETRRLEPGNLKPARDILADDIAGEGSHLQFEELFLGTKITIGLGLFLVYATLVAVVVFLALRLWPQYASQVSPRK